MHRFIQLLSIPFLEMVQLLQGTFQLRALQRTFQLRATQTLKSSLWLVSEFFNLQREMFFLVVG